MRLLAVLTLSGLIFAEAALSQPIGEADLLRHIEILAGDAFEGREPGTIGENKTVNYIATEWSAAGLRPAGEKGSWYAQVPLVERTPETYRLRFPNASSGKAVRVRQEEVVLRSRNRALRQFDMPVVFSGYADRGEGEPSVAGKLVLLPRTPRENGGQIPDFHDRKVRLIQNGAVGVLTVLDEQDSWNRFQRIFRRASTALAGTENHAELEGVISFDQFRELVQPSGLDAEILLADRADLPIIDLDMVADAKAATQVRPYVSHNVIGKIRGADPESGAILFMGHWDHFGICRIENPQNPGKDRICNGAVDNASGISLLIESARRLAQDRPDRDIYFLATTAEEKGLLGARAFTQNPPVAIDKFEVVFNADTVALADDGQKIAVLGLGESRLDKDIERVAAQEGREIDRSGKSDPYVRRQDGYVFLRRDVPAYMITSAFADEQRLQAFIDGPYHDTSDEVNDALVLTGAAADANFHVALGRYFSSTETYPGIATSGSINN